MTVGTKATLLAAALGTAALGGPDLVMENIVVTRVWNVSGAVSIEFTYDMINVGDAPIDLGGPDPGTPLDNVGVQTYLADEHDLSGLVRAAAGGAIFNPVVLTPDALYQGIFVSNTNQLPDPTQLGDFRWLVIDITNTAEDPADTANNRRIVWVPIPCGSADIAPPLGLLDLGDVTMFAQRFLAGDPSADLDGNGLHDLGDVLEFIDAFVAGCDG
jgi:hypothetical protein